MYLHFDVVLSDVSAFLVDGDYSWNQIFGKDTDKSSHGTYINILPIIDKCGVILKLQQVTFLDEKMFLVKNIIV